MKNPCHLWNDWMPLNMQKTRPITSQALKIVYVETRNWSVDATTLINRSHEHTWPNNQDCPFAEPLNIFLISYLQSHGFLFKILCPLSTNRAIYICVLKCVKTQGTMEFVIAWHPIYDISLILFGRHGHVPLVKFPVCRAVDQWCNIYKCIALPIFHTSWSY